MNTARSGQGRLRRAKPALCEHYRVNFLTFFRRSMQAPRMPDPTVKSEAGSGTPLPPGPPWPPLVCTRFSNCEIVALPLPPTSTMFLFTWTVLVAVVKTTASDGTGGGLLALSYTVRL